MMRTDGHRELRRPAGAVLRPLGFLAAVVASGLGMWHALMQDGATQAKRSSSLARHHRQHVRPVHP